VTGSGARGLVLPLLFYLPITALLLAPHVTPWTEYSTQTFDSLDAHISMWSLWWTGQALSQLHNPFWTDHVFFPRGTSLAFHSYPFVYGMLSIPLQHMVPGKPGLAIAFNALIVASFVLSSVAAYRLTLHVTRSRPGALIAGLIYAFMPYHILNSCRLAVLAIEIMPLYVFSLLRLHETRSWRWTAAVSLCLGLAYYNSVEYALYLLLFSALWLAHRVYTRDPGIDRVLLGRLAAAALLLALAAAPLLVQQLQVAAAESRAVGHKLADATHWSAALASFVTPNRVHPLFGGLWAFAGEFRDGVTHGMRSETALGWTPLLLAALAFADRRERPLFWGGCALVFFGLCLGPYLRLTGDWATSIPLPYYLLYEVFPPLRAVKEPTRMFPLAMLLLSVLAGFGVRSLVQRLGARPRRALALTGLLGAAILFEYLTAWPWQRTPHASVAVAPFYARLAREPEAVSIMDLTGPDATLEAQPVHGKKSVEWLGFLPRAAVTSSQSALFELGRVLTDPRTLLAHDPASRAARLAQYRSALRASRTRYILLPPLAGERRAFAQAVADALGGWLRQEPGMLLIELPLPAPD